MSELLSDFLAWLAALGQTLVGLFFMAGGSFWFWHEIHEPTVHATHLSGAMFLAVFGACVLPSIGPAIVRGLSGVVDAAVKLAGAVVSILSRTPPPNGGLPKDGG